MDDKLMAQLNQWHDKSKHDQIISVLEEIGGWSVIVML